MSESLSDKLKSLGVQIGTQNLPPAQPKAEKFPIESVLRGVDLATAYGLTFMVENRLEIDYLHGDVVLLNEVNPHIISAWARINDLSPALLDRVLFLDTETSGLAGGRFWVPIWTPSDFSLSDSDSLIDFHSAAACRIKLPGGPGFLLCRPHHSLRQGLRKPGSHLCSRRHARAPAIR